jgi:hypothetical protein
LTCNSIGTAGATGVTTAGAGVITVVAGLAGGLVAAEITIELQVN